eukprot:1586487-Amphidinium_carterae.2
MLLRALVCSAVCIPYPPKIRLGLSRRDSQLFGRAPDYKRKALNAFKVSYHLGYGTVMPSTVGTACLCDVPCSCCWWS